MMEDKRCPVFVDGKECGLPLTFLDRESDKVAPHNIAAYECELGHRSHFLQESIKSVSRKYKRTAK
jgi:hypothetical protein